MYIRIGNLESRNKEITKQEYINTMFKSLYKELQ